MSTGTWPQAYYDWASGVMVADSGTRWSVAPRASVADLLNALPGNIRRVYLCGLLPVSGGIANYLGMRAIDSTLLWGATLPASSDWAENPDRRHYCSEEDDPGSLVLRYRHRNNGREVEVGSLARWVGDALALSASPEDARWLFAWLTDALNTAFVVHSRAPWRDPPVIYNTPSLTGRVLLDLTLHNAHREIPLLSEPEQALLRSILPQARVEHFAPPFEGAMLSPGACYMDGRLMYAASMTGLGTGPLTRDETPDYLGPYQPAFYRVTLRVPASWPAGMPGILAVKAGPHPEDGWRWPHTPREQAETWAGERELAAALWPQPRSCPDCAAGRSGKRRGVACPQHGWHLQIHEHALLVRASSGPLDLWAKKLTDLYQDTTHTALSTGDACYRLARAAIRALLHNTLGSFHSDPASGHRLTRIATRGDDIPPGRGNVLPLLVPGGGGDDGGGMHTVYRYTETVPLDHGDLVRAARWYHPELSAQVWSRCRGRLLLAQVGGSGADGGGGRGVMTGMLALPPFSVVAAQTDALLLTHDPADPEGHRWPDDGRPGRLRTKHVLRGGESVPWPHDWDEVEAVKHAMEATETTRMPGGVSLPRAMAGAIR